MIMLTFSLHSCILKMLTASPFLLYNYHSLVYLKMSSFFQVGPQVWLGITEKELDMCMAARLKRAHIRAALVGICFKL